MTIRIFLVVPGRWHPCCRTFDGTAFDRLQSLCLVHICDSNALEILALGNFVVQRLCAFLHELLRITHECSGSTQVAPIVVFIQLKLSAANVRCNIALANGSANLSVILSVKQIGLAFNR